MNYNMAYNQIKHVLSAFRFEGRYSRAEELHSGNVNNTYHLYYALPAAGARNTCCSRSIPTRSKSPTR